MWKKIEKAITMCIAAFLVVIAAAVADETMERHVISNDTAADAWARVTANPCFL